MPESFTTPGGCNAEFRAAMWTRILNTKERDSSVYKKILNYPVTAYWKPAYKGSPVSNNIFTVDVRQNKRNKQYSLVSTFSNVQ